LTKKKATGKRVTKRKTQRKAPAGTISGECMRKDWQTPEDLLVRLRRYFGGQIPFDAATAKDNPTKARKFATEEDNSLLIKWPSQTFINPPYGDSLPAFVGKMAWEAILGNTVIGLLPCSRWEQRYFQEALYRANAVCFIRKRVSFRNPDTGDEVDGNTYATMWVGWNVDLDRFVDAFGSPGRWGGVCQEWRPLCSTPPDKEPDA
jgi:phage N-6-adenine-methyltransferase